MLYLKREELEQICEAIVAKSQLLYDMQLEQRDLLMKKLKAENDRARAFSVKYHDMPVVTEKTGKQLQELWNVREAMRELMVLADKEVFERVSRKKKEN